MSARFRAAAVPDFALVARAPIRDANLSWEALGVLTWLLDATSSGEDVSMARLLDARRGGRDRMRRILAELKKAAYLTCERVAGEGGRFEWIWTVHGLRAAGAAPAAPAEPEPPPKAPRWDELYQVLARDMGVSVVHSRGKRRAWIGTLARLLGEHAGDDPERALKLWQAFVADQKQAEAWAYITTRNVQERTGRWLQEGGPRAGFGYKAAKPVHF